MNTVDFSRWKKFIEKSTWYFDIVDDMQSSLILKEKDPSKWEEFKEQVYDFFETHLKEKDIVLGVEGKKWDDSRQQIDTAVIHHTQMKPNLTPERLSAVTLIRLYATYFANPYDKEDAEIKGRPIFSGHVRNGEQVFWPYHWIIRGDGTRERLLEDNEIGWHAGKWDINCRSVGIVFDNDYENSEPSNIEIHSLNQLLKEHYPQISHNRIFGHREINPKTTCPGNLFLSHDVFRGWKEKILPEVISDKFKPPSPL